LQKELKGLESRRDFLLKYGGEGNADAVNNSLKELDYRIAALKANLKAIESTEKKKIKGDVLPPEDVRSYESRIREAMMKAMKAEEKMTELSRQRKLADLEYEHRVLGLSDEEYNKRKLDVVKESIEEESKIIGGGRIAIRKIFDAEMKKLDVLRDEEKKRALRAVLTSTEAEISRMEERNKTDVHKAEIDARIANYEDYRKSVERIQTAMYNVMVAGIEDQLIAERTSISIRKQEIENLYDTGRMSAALYFSTLKTLSEKETEAAIEAEKKKLQAFLDRMSSIRSAMEKIGVAIPADVEEAFEAEKTEKIEAFTKAVNRLKLELDSLLKGIDIRRRGTPAEVFADKGFLGTFRSYLEEATRYFGDWGVHLKTLAEDVAKSMSQSFSDLFFDALTGKLSSFSDYFNAFANSILRTWTNIAGQMVALNLTKSASLIAGLFHGGGVIPSGYRIVPSNVFANAPRFHTGLASDEFPAILQTGETVLPRGTGLGPKSVVVNVNNQTGIPVGKEDVKIDFDLEKMVVGIILKNKMNNGPLRGV
jgi:hypothetical protein